MENNIIPAINNTLATMSFKNEKLKAATIEHIKRYEKAQGAIVTAIRRRDEVVDKYYRDTAVMLARLEKDGSLSEDGYKSPNDFAIKALGFKSGTASQLVTAGRMYLSDKASAEVKALSPANYRTVATIPLDKLNADMEAGTIKPDSKQNELKAYAQANIESKTKPVVLKRYDAYIHGSEKPFHKVTEADMTLVLLEELTGNSPDAKEPEVVKLPSDADKNPRRLIIGENRILLVTFKPITEDGANKSAKLTKREQMIQRMKANGLSDEQIAEILD